jgi:hypothetical protein
MKGRTSKWSHLFDINKITPIFGNIQRLCMLIVQSTTCRHSAKCPMAEIGQNLSSNF